MIFREVDREGRKEEKMERDRNTDVKAEHPSANHRGSGLKPGHVPWPVRELSNLWGTA